MAVTLRSGLTISEASQRLATITSFSFLISIVIISCGGGSLQIVTPAAGQCIEAADGWERSYSPEHGVCLYTESASRGQYNYTQAAARCAAATVPIGPAGVARPVRPDTDAKKIYLLTFLLQKSYGYSTMWTEASCNVATRLFQWSNNASAGAACVSATDRLYLQFTLAADNTAKSGLNLATTPSQEYIPVCEYDVPRCNPNTIPGYSAASIALSAWPYANRTVRFNCAPGRFRQSEIVLDKTATAEAASAAAAAVAARNLYFCQFVPPIPSSSGIGSANFVPLGATASVGLESCEPVNCKGWHLLNTTQIPDAEDTYKSAVVAGRQYAFGEKVPVTCRQGYVSYYDESSINTTVECGQSDLNPSLGMWVPPSLSVCFAVQCKAPMPHYDSAKMIAFRAYDRSKDRSYSSGESNRFPYYPNVVSLKCREEGYFFMDRKYDKSLQCNLPGNGSYNIGVWMPVDGTILSSDVMNCKKITCRTNEIVIPIQQSDLPGALEELNLNDTVTVTDETDAVRNLTVREFTQISDMTYTSRLRVYCQYPFDMSVTSAVTGRMEMVDTYEVTCAPSGTWSNKITACIKRTESIMTQGGKKYIPPAKEAKGAQSLGLVVIIILIVFFTTVIILDLTTITRDVRLMKRNLSRIRLKWQQTKRA